MNNWRDDLTGYELNAINTAKFFAEEPSGLTPLEVLQAGVIAKLAAKLDAAHKPIPDVFVVDEARAAELSNAIKAALTKNMTMWQGELRSGHK